MKITAEVLLCKVYGNKSDDSAFPSVHVMTTYLDLLRCETERVNVGLSRSLPLLEAYSVHHTVLSDVTVLWIHAHFFKLKTCNLIGAAKILALVRGNVALLSYQI